LTKEVEIIIVGAGIAGLSAALTAARLGRSTLVLTGDVLGGHLLNIEKIDGYPGFADGIAGYDLCPIAQEQAMAAGAEFALASATGIEHTDDHWLLNTAGETYRARSIILATGTELLTLDVPGESLLRGKGVSQCASCDAPLLRDQTAVVAGGGDSALQEALVLAEHCAEVFIVHHGEEYLAQSAYIHAAKQNPKIKAKPNSEITAILGQDAVAGVRIADKAGGESVELGCAAVFGFIGLKANTAFIDAAAILDGAGAILTDSNMRTALPGVLAAGTVRADNAGRAAAAAGDGATAALSAHAFLADRRWLADATAIT
jgi:thioredoxin reductase (NADPH)